MRWSPSTDDFAPPSFIRYDVYVNGELPLRSWLARPPQRLSSTSGETSTITVIAVDTADNESVPGTITVGGY